MWNPGGSHLTIKYGLNMFTPCFLLTYLSILQVSWHLFDIQENKSRCLVDFPLYVSDRNKINKSPTNYMLSSKLPLQFS